MLAPALLAFVVTGATPDLGAEAKRRTDLLISQGFNLTHGFTLDARKEETTVRLEFLVPLEEREHTFSFWAQSAAGSLAFRVLGPNGQVLIAWSGRTGDSTLTLHAAPGQYVVELDREAQTAGRALFGVRGAALSKCEVEAQEHAASPSRGFHWPYLRQVRWFFFLGAEDSNDAVPFRDSFSKADEDLVFRRFGKTPVSRWKRAEQLYLRAGLDARFVLYPGTGHQVTEAMSRDIALFFEKQ